MEGSATNATNKKRFAKAVRQAVHQVFCSGHETRRKLPQKKKKKGVGGGEGEHEGPVVADTVQTAGHTGRSSNQQALPVRW